MLDYDISTQATSKIHGILAVELVQVELEKPKVICKEGRVHWCWLKLKNSVCGDAGSGVIGASMLIRGILSVS
jgi:hypothetical protein